VRVKAAVLEESRELWIADAVAAIHAIATERGSVCADDLRSELRTPGHSNWAGLAFTRAVELGYITSVGRKPSAVKSRRSARIDVWAAVRSEA
jgi:hypothetical protein